MLRNGGGHGMERRVRKAYHRAFYLLAFRRPLLFAIEVMGGWFYSAGVFRCEMMERTVPLLYSRGQL